MARETMFTMPSVAATSMNCPLPVARWEITAARMAMAACMPPPALSAAVAPGIMGGPPARPVSPTVPPID
jgi:hypothetical protein